MQALTCFGWQNGENMKIVLAGFSAQNAAALSLLIIQKYNEHSVVEMDLSFGNNLRLCLPTLPAHHQDAKAMIINLSGVGMPNISPEQLSELQGFVGGRAGLLIAPKQMAILDELNDPLLSCIVSPYTKDTMERALQALLATATTVTVPSYSADDKKPIASQIRSAPTDSVPSHFLYELLRRHFDIPQMAFLTKFVDITLSNTPVQVTIGTQMVYIEPSLNMALVSNWGRLMDACMVVGKFEDLTDVIQVTPITKRVFAGVNDETIQKYPISTLLWQMADRLLPKKVEVADHPLLLKIRFMPNFGNELPTPAYVRALVSSCLLKPKTLDMLMIRMDKTADKGLVNRVFLLAILSGVADRQILQQSFDGGADEQIAQEPTPAQNQGVQKAQKTGFLARFLNKLGL